MPSILVASDAPSVRSEILAVVDGRANEVEQVASGPEVLAAVAEKAPDLLVVDMQMGNMGGMAVCLDLRLEESYGALPHIPVLMLLDRRADVFLARRSGAEGWLVKPLDPIRIRKAAAALVSGGTFHDMSFHPLPELVVSATSAQSSAPQPPPT